MGLPLRSMEEWKGGSYPVLLGVGRRSQRTKWLYLLHEDTSAGWNLSIFSRRLISRAGEGAVLINSENTGHCSVPPWVACLIPGVTVLKMPEPGKKPGSST